MNILVIDVGTSSMRGILFSHDGNELIEYQKAYKAMYMKNGWVEQSPSDWENALYEIMTNISTVAVEKRWTIDGVTITSQRSSVIPVDSEIHPLCNAIMWQDKRTADICEVLSDQNDKVFSLCGSRVNPVFSASKMTWIRNNCPDLYEKIYKFMVIPDYLIYLLTGKLCIDYTYGSRSLLMNVYSCQWDDELLDLFQVKREHLLDLIEPGSICGYLTKQIQECTGCPAGIPVVTAGGDQQCGAIGQGIVKEGIMSVTAGTGGFLITAVDHIPENIKQDVIIGRSSIKNQYMLEANILTCCSAFDWFRKEFYENISLNEINKILEETPVGANACMCVPYFQGRSTPDWNDHARGVFANISLGTSKADMMRSLLEGICFEIKNGIENMENYLDILDVYVNGGLTNSDIFNKIQCNVYGKKIIRRGKTDATARGALIIAATNLGIYTDIEDASAKIMSQNEEKIYYPEIESVLFYEQAREKMNDFYTKIKE